MNTLSDVACDPLPAGLPNIPENAIAMAVRRSFTAGKGFSQPPPQH